MILYFSVCDYIALRHFRFGFIQFKVILFDADASIVFQPVKHHLPEYPQQRDVVNFFQFAFKQGFFRFDIHMMTV